MDRNLMMVVLERWQHGSTEMAGGRSVATLAPDERRGMMQNCTPRVSHSVSQLSNMEHTAVIQSNEGSCFQRPASSHLKNG
jgi:hypothetical protein